jgi:hypothetical protein
MPPLITWHTFQMIVNYVFFLWMLMFWTSLVTIGYCLMHYSMPLPCVWNVRKKSQNQIVNLIDNDFGIDFELYLSATNIKREVCDVLDYIF